MVTNEYIPMKSMKINVSKDLILKLLWFISICDILILLTLFTLSEYFSQNQANTQLQQAFAYIAFNFPKTNLFIGLMLISALMIGIYFLQFSQKKEHKDVDSTINCLCRSLDMRLDLQDTTRCVILAQTSV